MKKKASLSSVIATFFGIGYISFAPGTFGSIVAFPVYFLLTYMLIVLKGGVASLGAPGLINGMLVWIVGLFFIGLWAADKYSKDTGNEDPKEVVIDEVVGQLLTICLIVWLVPNIGGEAVFKFENIGINKFNLVLLNLLSAFVLFRLFDIFKPWPINYIEKRYKGGLGIMLDDVVAAIFAVVVHFFILYAIIDRI
jgi:phosphatidylglycerophosphatase A